jgi:t-SNARE complex subunit (syntaxin)
MRIWTEDDADAARIMTRVWRWRIYGLLVIAAVVVILALVSKG